MKKPLLVLIIVFPVATLIFWVWLGLHDRKPLPAASPADTNAPTLITNSPTR